MEEEEKKGLSYNCFFDASQVDFRICNYPSATRLSLSATRLSLSATHLSPCCRL